MATESALGEQLENFRATFTTPNVAPDSLFAKKGLLISRDNFRDLLPFQFDPSAYTEQESSEWGNLENISTARPMKEWKRGGKRTVSFSLLYDDASRPEGTDFIAYSALRWIQAAVRPSTQTLYALDSVSPVVPPRAVGAAAGYPAVPSPILFDDDLTPTFPSVHAPPPPSEVVGHLEEGRSGKKTLSSSFARGDSLDRFRRNKSTPVSESSVPPDGNYFGPKRLFLVRGARPLFSCVITKVNFRSLLFHGRKGIDDLVPARVEIDIELTELVQTNADLTASGYNIDPLADVRKKDASTLTERFEAGRKSVTNLVGKE